MRREKPTIYVNFSMSHKMETSHVGLSKNHCMAQTAGGGGEGEEKLHQNGLS